MKRNTNSATATLRYVILLLFLFSFCFFCLSSHFHSIFLSLLTQICWSKNVQTEANVQNQIMLGAGNVDYYVLLGMASWLVYSLSTGWQDSSNYLLLCYDSLNNHDAIKKAATNNMSTILKDNHFAVGDHSIQKSAAQYSMLVTRGVPVMI